MKLKVLCLTALSFLSFEAHSEDSRASKNLELAARNEKTVELKEMKNPSFSGPQRLRQKESERKKLRAQKKSAGEKDSKQLHSFRPLLIQGGKKIKRNTKNIKVDINSISETEVFFIEPDFKKRIYLDEGAL